MPTCPICRQWFLDTDALERHIIDEHPMQDSDAENINLISQAAFRNQTLPQVSVGLLKLSLEYKMPIEEVVHRYYDAITLLCGAAEVEEDDDPDDDNHSEEL